MSLIKLESFGSNNDENARYITSAEIILCKRYKTLLRLKKKISLEEVEHELGITFIFLPQLKTHILKLIRTKVNRERVLKTLIHEIRKTNSVSVVLPVFPVKGFHTFSTILSVNSISDMINKPDHCYSYVIFSQHYSTDLPRLFRLESAPDAITRIIKDQR